MMITLHFGLGQIRVLLVEGWIIFAKLRYRVFDGKRTITLEFNLHQGFTVIFAILNKAAAATWLG